MRTSISNAGQPEFDVAILGTGIGGTILGAILARHGVKVLLLEQGVHPRFTIGESTVPETTILFRVLAQRYDVPEIGHLSSYHQVLRHISSSCGVKRNFTFFYHRPQSPQRPLESTQLNTVGPPVGPDVHLFRQDSDAYMMAVAMQYGARVLQQVQVTDLEIGDSEVVLAAKDGREFRARYVVDAGGLKSMLAHKLNLRIDPCPMRTRSRSIFTHMVGVRPYDECAPRNFDLLGAPSQGTLHHLFEGGWMWVIPFNNHPSSTNRLVSVGINLDVDVHPPSGAAPESEFWSIVQRFPTISQQFKTAVAVREYTGTGRMQFASTTSVGDRFCMLPHAFSFVDPLFSSGLGITMNAVNGIASRLIQASRDGDYSARRFAHVDTWIKKNFDYFDRLVAGSYLSFRSFDLWNAWTRLWMIGGLLGSFQMYELLHRGRRSPDPICDPVYEQFPYRGTQASELTEYAALFSAAEQHMNEVRQGSVSPTTAAERIFAEIDRSRLWPAPWGKLSPVRPRHAGSFTIGRLLPVTRWIRRRSPGTIRQYLYVVPRTRDVLWAALADLKAAVTDAVGTLRRILRDYALDYNRDWRRLRVPRMTAGWLDRQTVPAAAEAGHGTAPAPMLVEPVSKERASHP
jgi:FADH2 O2-dependent halogenase